MVIHGTHDPEVGIQVFELDNPTFRSTIEVGSELKLKILPPLSLEENLESLLILKWC